MNSEFDNQKLGLILVGGLGNQLFQYSAALSIATQQKRAIEFVSIGLCKTNSSGFPEILDYSFNSEYSSFSHTPRYSSHLGKITNILLRISNYEGTGCGKKTIGRLVFSLFGTLIQITTKWRVISPHGLGFDAIFQVPNSKVALLGNFQSHKWISSAAKEKLKEQLQLKGESEIVETFRKIAEYECPTAIHIRLGDYLEISELNVISKGYFKSAVELLEQNSQTTKYWIFTNDVDKFQNYLPEAISQRMRVIPNELSSCETLEIMRLCRNYIISNSTFSWWGAFLSRNENPTVIAPKDWFRSHSEPFQICPEGWIRI